MNREEQDTEITGNALRDAYFQKPRNLKEKEKFMKMGRSLGWLINDTYLTAEKYVAEKMRLLDEITDKNEWMDEVRRISAICDLLFFNKCDYNDTHNEENVSFNGKRYESANANGPPTEGIKKELVPI